MIVTPTILVLLQPNLGTSLMLILAGATVMFAAGVSLWYFAAVITLGVAAVVGVFTLRAARPGSSCTTINIARIDTFLDPTADPLGAGYNIIQAKIALGSGGWSGKGFMQGTQSRLNFLPEKHTDFIFTTLAEEFGFIGAFSLLGLYALIIGFCLVAAFQEPRPVLGPADRGRGGETSSSTSRSTSRWSWAWPRSSACPCRF